MKKQVHAHSREAYRTGSVSEIPQRQREVLAVFRSSRVPLSDRQVMKALGHVDPNKVRPAITTLVDLGVLFEVDAARDAETGKTVRFCSVSPRSDPKQPELFPLDEVTR